jgi:hypothetical protein
MALQITLLDLVKAVSTNAASQAAVKATVVHLASSGIVQLCEQMRPSKWGIAPIALYRPRSFPS